MAEVQTLKRKLSLWQVSISGVGVILGAGVYALIGPAAGYAGNAVWLVFLLASVAASLTAYSYARLAPLRPLNSVEFQYTSLAFGPRVGFVAGWIMLTADLMAAATVSLGFGAYVQHLTGVPSIAGALGLVLGIAALLLVGIGESITLALVLTIVEAAGLLFIIAIGLPSLGSVNYLELPTSDLGGIGLAVGLIVFAYLGFDELGNLAEEMHNPGKDLPRALFISMATSTLVYVLVALSAVSVLGWHVLSQTPAPLATVSGKVLGGQGDTLFSWIALAATANTSLLLLVSGSRSLYGLGTAVALPRALGRVNKRGLPYVASAVALGVVACFTLIGEIERVASLTNAAVLGSFMLVNASLLRVASTGKLRPLFLDKLFPLAALICCAWIMWFTGWQSILTAGVLAALGWVIGNRTSSTPTSPERTP